MSEVNPVETIFNLVHALKKNITHKIESLESRLTPMHVQVLKLIAASTSRITANDIANTLQRDKAQVTRLLNTLIKEELIEKQENPKDKRSQFIVATLNGKQIYQQVIEVDRYILEGLAQGLSYDELAQFQHLSEKMIKNLEANQQT
ncbi:MAG: MarR family transcriptional regulator [Gammaproteobacteria bacterium]|nr:MarR family transcriptional regulator [Gammaproteobacteria bacterium]